MFSIRCMVIYGISLLFLLLNLLFYILGAARYVTDFEENTCDMTYMFEYPQYVRISLDDNIEEHYPRYGLYAYGEGFVTEKLRRMHFTGIPVLFVPGNAGSHEQVRSLASVSLRKSLKDRTSFHFDFFTVSLGKDYSALYGGVLMEETVYVSHCIQKILSLYKSDVDNVILIGHSMGGIIAKGALLLTPNVNASVASIIINLATPHTPTLVLDSTFANYYYNLESRLSQIKDAGTTVVSIGGGPRDILVTPAQVLDPTADINVLSPSIPDVWKSTDHLSILWCKQLILSIVRSLFDCVNYSQRPSKILSRHEDRMRAFWYHMFHRASGKRLYHYKEKVQFEPDGEWIEDIRNQYVWNNKNYSKKTSSVYLMIRLNGRRDNLTINAINLEAKDWLFACTASKIQGQSRVCDWGWNLTNRTSILPDPVHRLRKTVDLDLREIKYSGVTHVVVRIPSDDMKNHVTVNVDLYSYNNRLIPIEGSLSLFKSLFRKRNAVQSGRGNIRYYATLNIVDVITVELKATECTDPKHHAIVELLEPRNIGPTQIQYFTVVDDGPKTMKIQVGHKYRDTSPRLRITLDPACSYTINIEEGGRIDQISCIVRDRWSILYTTIISLILLVVSIRVDHDHEKNPTIVITIFLSLYYGLIFECCIAMAILSVFIIGLCSSIAFLGSVAHSIAVRFLARAIAFSITWSDWLLGGLNQLPFITAIFVLSLIPTTCGALAMLISVFLYFLNVTKMYENYIEELLMASLQHFNRFARLRSSSRNSSPQQEDTREKIFGQIIFFTLWCFIAIPAVPSVLVWAKNFSYDMRLSTEDPLLQKSWTILVACSTLGWIQIPSHHSPLRKQILANILRFISWIILSMGAAPNPPFYQYYMPPTVAGVISIIALNFIIP